MDSEKKLLIINNITSTTNNNNNTTNHFISNNYSNFAENKINQNNNQQSNLSLKPPKNPSIFKLLSDDLKPKNIWAYGIGHFMNDICASIWFFLLSYYLIQIIGLEEHSASYVLLFGQVADALATPLVGLLSDKFSTAYGKRFPWYLAGTIIVTISFSLIFFCVLPPDSTENAKVFYYSCFAALFNIGWAAVQVSHMALLPSITLDTKKKDMMTKIRTGFTFLAQTLTFLFSFVFFKCIKNKILQYQALAGSCIIIGVLSSIYFLVFCKEWELSKNIPKYFDNILVFMGKKSSNKAEEINYDNYNNNKLIDCKKKKEKEEEVKLQMKINEDKINNKENEKINEFNSDYKKFKDEDENAIIYKHEKNKNDINANSICKIDQQIFDNMHKKNLLNNKNKNIKFEEAKNSEISYQDYSDNKSESNKNYSNYSEADIRNNHKAIPESNLLNANKLIGKAYYKEDLSDLNNNINELTNAFSFNQSSYLNNINKVNNESLEYVSNNVLYNYEANSELKDEIVKMHNCNLVEKQHNHEENSFCENKKRKKIINWLYWLKKPDFYYYMFVYMFVRLSINITSIVIPFYMEFVLKFQKSSEGGTPYEITVCLLVSTLGSIFNSVYLQKFFEVDSNSLSKNNKNTNTNLNHNTNINNNNNNINHHNNINNKYYSKFQQTETNNNYNNKYANNFNIFSLTRKRQMETAKRNKRLYLILVSLFFISIGCLPLFILNSSIRNSIYVLSFLWGIGFSQALSCVSSLTNDVVGKNGAKGAFVYGAFSFADKLSCGIVLVFYLPLANNNELYLRYSVPFFPPAAVFFGTLFIFVKIFFVNKKFKEESALEIDVSYKRIKDEDCSSDEFSIENFDQHDG
jgi:Na+/melibiose symporter-like transporter